MTPSEMARKGNANMTQAARTARAKKGAAAAARKYGKDRMKQVRAGKKLKPIKKV